MAPNDNILNQTDLAESTNAELVEHKTADRTHPKFQNQNIHVQSSEVLLQLLIVN